MARDDFRNIYLHSFDMIFGIINIKLNCNYKGSKMFKHIVLSLFIALSFSEDFTLEDLNSSSQFFGQEVGPSSFPNEVYIAYFGHFT